MIEIVQATPEDAESISKMCSAAWRATYTGLYPQAYIERVVAQYYNLERITREVRDPPTKAWGGHIVAKEAGAVVGAVEGRRGRCGCSTSSLTAAARV